MDFIIDAIVEWLKGLLVDGIMGNLDGLFDNVNQSVGEIATQVGTTPADWNAGVFSMIRQISETAILPIAGVILTFVMTYELIQMLIERKCWTGAYCRYFREAVLPLNPELQASLTTEGISPELRACAVCGKAFLPEGRQAYCSDACKAEGNRRKSRERMRKMREKRPGDCYDLPPPKA